MHTRLILVTSRCVPLALRNRAREMLGQQRSRDEIARLPQSEFTCAEFPMQSLDGLLAELR